MLETLEQASKSIKATAACRIQVACRESGETIQSAKGTSATPQSRLESGYSSESCAAMARMSSRPCARETPTLSRPNISSRWSARVKLLSGAYGTQTSGLPSSVKLSGTTPMTVQFSPLR